MRYASIDIETTGLDRSRDRILEIGIVIADTEDLRTPIAELPSFRKILKWDRISGHPYALYLNAGLIEEIVKGESLDLIPPFELIPLMGGFFTRNNLDPENVIAAGKNFATFDREFINVHASRIKSYGTKVNFKHRVLDPMMYFIEASDSVPPDTKLCCERAGIKNGGHRALDDARMVVHLLRIGMNPTYDFCRLCGSVYHEGEEFCKACVDRQREEVSVLPSISLGPAGSTDGEA